MVVKCRPIDRQLSGFIMQTLRRLDYLNMPNACQLQILKDHAGLGLFYARSSINYVPWNRTYRPRHGRPTTCLTSRNWCTPKPNYSLLYSSHFPRSLLGLGIGLDLKSPILNHSTINKHDSHSFSSDKSINQLTTSPTKFSRLATKVEPYLQLMRIDKPVGTLLLFWPTGWSIAMAAAPGSLPDLELLAVCALGALIMRGAGCTINDMWDKDLDKKVLRTKDRPLAAGKISRLDALVFLGGQLGLGLLVLQHLNWYTVVLASSCVGLIVVYPLCKRITYWPQAVLGIVFNWGALVGWAAVQGSCDWLACLPLYAACFSWTIFYDTIYAHQDKKDDLLVGIKSTALRFGENTKLWLSVFGASMVSGLVMCGIHCDQTWPYYGAVGLVATHLASQLFSLNINNRSDCAQKFNSNQRIGVILFLGIVLGTLMKGKEMKKRETSSSILVEKDVLKIGRVPITN